MNFTWPVFLVGANIVFVGIRYKHLEYKASKASPFYTTEPNSLRAAHPAGTERSHKYPIPDRFYRRAPLKERRNLGMKSPTEELRRVTSLNGPFCQRETQQM